MDLSIKGEYIELCKLLKVAGLVMSGGEGKTVVAEGLVTVDGRFADWLVTVSWRP